MLGLHWLRKILLIMHMILIKLYLRLGAFNLNAVIRQHWLQLKMLRTAPSEFNIILLAREIVLFLSPQTQYSYLSMVMAHQIKTKILQYGTINSRIKKIFETSKIYNSELLSISLSSYVNIYLIFIIFSFFSFFFCYLLCCLWDLSHIRAFLVTLLHCKSHLTYELLCINLSLIMCQEWETFL